MGPHETEKFCKAKETVYKTQRKPTEYKKIFISFTFVRGLISKIYKEFKKLDIKIPTKPIKMGYRFKQNSQQKNPKCLRYTLKSVQHIFYFLGKCTHQINQ